MHDVPGRVEDWHIPRKTTNKWVRYRSQTQTVEWLNTWHQTVLVTFLGFRKPLYNCTERMCHSSTRPGMSLQWLSFTRSSPALLHFSKFLQHPVARVRTVSSNQIAEGFEFCSLIGSHGCRCFNQKLQELENAVVLQVTNSGVKRSGYEATYIVIALLYIPSYKFTL